MAALTNSLFTALTSAKEVDVDLHADQHTVYASGTTGTVSISVLPYGASNYEALTENGLPVVITLSAPVTKVFRGGFKKIKFTPSGLSGQTFLCSVVSHGTLPELK